MYGMNSSEALTTWIAACLNSTYNRTIPSQISPETLLTKHFATRGITLNSTFFTHVIGPTSPIFA
jgi:hypothetical protein